MDVSQPLAKKRRVRQAQEMKTIGLVGGMGWESTALYYQAINRAVARELGGTNSAKLVIYSFNFQELVERVHQNRWHEIGSLLSQAGRRLKDAGADFLLLCANTAHKCAEQVERESGLPLLHILEPTVRQAKAAGMRTVAVLGTRFVMEQKFYSGRLERDGLKVVIPADDDRAFAHDVIFGELTKGIFTEATRARCREIISKLVREGAQGIVLGCTELPMLLKAEDSAVPMLDTTILHAEEAAVRAMEPARSSSVGRSGSGGLSPIRPPKGAGLQVESTHCAK
jgi:aspartate racemase